MNEVINKLKIAIEKLPGQKIVTLGYGHSNQATFDRVSGFGSPGHIKIDVDENGRWGYEPGHYLLFAMKAMRALNGVGGMIVRQFLDQTFVDAKGRTLPRKRIYAIKLGDGKAIPSSAEECEKCCNTCRETGEPIAPEPGVEYGILTLEEAQQ